MKKLLILGGLLVMLVGCTEELILFPQGTGGSACSSNDTYCLDLELLSGDYATHNYTSITDTRSSDNQTFYEHLVSS